MVDQELKLECSATALAGQLCRTSWDLLRGSARDHESFSLFLGGGMTPQAI